MDDVGLNVVLDIEEHYAEVLPDIPQGPRDLCKRMIAQGKLGKKSGKGFYDYTQTDISQESNAIKHANSNISVTK